MKKKILSIVLIICAVFSLSFLSNKNAFKSSAEAYSINSNTYTISDDGDTLSVTKGAENSEFTDNHMSIDEAVESIISDQTLDDSSTIEIFFDNVSLENEEQITLTRNFLFSGTLNISNTVPFFIANHSSEQPSLITFQDFKIKNTNDIIEEFSFLEVEGTKTNITLFNAQFDIETASISQTHTIHFSSTNHSITLKGEASHSTTLFYNYIDGIELIIDDDDTIEDNFFEDSEGNPTTSTSTLKISIPYDSSNSVISNYSTRTNLNRFEFIPQNSNYNVTPQLMDNRILCSAHFNFNFDYDDAIITEDYIAPSKFTIKNYNEYIFPTTENMAKEHYTFDGWFGKINYNDTDYYFNQTLLKTFIDSNKTTSEIPSIFKTSVNDFSIETSFTKYKYSSKGTENALAEYEAVNFLAQSGNTCSFVAKWNVNSFTVTFDSNEGTPVESQTINYGAKITQPASPTKTGYDFIGWFESLDSNTAFDFENETMPAENITLVAKWQIQSYTITFITNNDETISPITYDFNETISAFETLSKTGFDFGGWFEYNTETFEVSDTEFNIETMPARNITVYAKWSVSKVKIIFDTKGGSSIAEQTVDYGSSVEKPADPTKTGYTFNGWYYNYNCTEANKVTFDQNNSITITTETTLYANWLANSYHLNIYKNIDNTFERQTLFFGSSITRPETPTRANYIFEGWYLDSNFTNTFNLTTMPAYDVSIYAKWKAKPLPTFDESTQYYDTNIIYPEFVNKNQLEGFIIKYYVDGSWVLDPPTNAGSYDILVIRNEDDNYARYEKILEDALVIERTEKDIMWLIVLLFVFAAFEFLVTIVARILRKMKSNMSIFALAIPIGNSFIPTNQTVLLFISGGLVIVGLILMCYQLVKLHRTVPLELLKEHDDEEVAKEHFEYNEKIIEEEVKSYSASDIENLLINDTVGQDLKDKHKLHELEKAEEKTAVPIAEIRYDEETESNIAIDSINNYQEPEDEMKPNVEYIDEEIVFNSETEDEKLYNSDDPFVRKDPDDYSN